MNPNSTSYPHYGARGISVCDRWLEFTAFRDDMGERPAGHTLDRIDTDGDYGPSNCRWATESEQQRNKRKSRVTPEIEKEIYALRAAGHSLSKTAASLGLLLYDVKNVLYRWKRRGK